MPDRSGPQLSDEALDRLARRWFADARAVEPKVAESKPGADATSDGSLLDRLFGGEDGSCDGDCD